MKREAVFFGLTGVEVRNKIISEIDAVDFAAEGVSVAVKIPEVGGLLGFVQIGDLVLQRGGVGEDVPLHLLGADEVDVEFELDTAVVHVTDVIPVAGVTGRGSHGEAVKHVGGVALEELDTSADVLQEAEFDTGVEVGVGFPSDVAGTLAREGDTYLTVGVADAVAVGVEEVADIVVTL